MADHDDTDRLDEGASSASSLDGDGVLPDQRARALRSRLVSAPDEQFRLDQTMELPIIE